MPAYNHCGLFSPAKRVGYYRWATGSPGQFFGFYVVGRVHTTRLAAWASD